MIHIISVKKDGGWRACPDEPGGRLFLFDNPFQGNIIAGERKESQVLLFHH
jgi:hypothetical protein